MKLRIYDLARYNHQSMVLNSVYFRSYCTPFDFRIAIYFTMNRIDIVSWFHLVQAGDMVENAFLGKTEEPDGA